MQNFFAHWKSTANGVLAFLIVTLTTISGFLGTVDLTTSHAPGLHSLSTGTWVALSINMALGLCRAWIGMLQLDPDKVMAKVPGIADPQVVPAHPVPDDPKAKAIIPQQ